MFDSLRYKAEDILDAIKDLGKKSKSYEVSIPANFQDGTIYTELYFRGKNSPTKQQIVTALESRLGDYGDEDPIIDQALDHVCKGPDNFEMGDGEIERTIEGVTVRLLEMNEI